MAVAITRRELSTRDLRASAAKTTDAKAARRMPAIALVMEGQGNRVWVTPLAVPRPSR
jgi:hypothetical protein